MTTDASTPMRTATETANGLIVELNREIEFTRSARVAFRRFTGRRSLTHRRKIEIVSNFDAADRRVAELERLRDKTESLPLTDDDADRFVHHIRSQIPHGQLQRKAQPESSAVMA